MVFRLKNILAASSAMPQSATGLLSAICEGMQSGDTCLFRGKPGFARLSPVCRQAGSRAFQRSAVRPRPESGRTVQAQAGRFDIRCAGEPEMDLSRNAGTDAYQVVVAVGADECMSADMRSRLAF